MQAWVSLWLWMWVWVAHPDSLIQSSPSHSTICPPTGFYTLLVLFPPHTTHPRNGSSRESPGNCRCIESSNCKSCWNITMLLSPIPGGA